MSSELGELRGQMTGYQQARDDLGGVRARLEDLLDLAREPGRERHRRADPRGVARGGTDDTSNTPWENKSDAGGLQYGLERGLLFLSRSRRARSSHAHAHGDRVTHAKPRAGFSHSTPHAVDVHANARGRLDRADAQREIRSLARERN